MGGLAVAFDGGSASVLDRQARKLRAPSSASRGRVAHSVLPPTSCGRPSHSLLSRDARRLRAATFLDFASPARWNGSCTPRELVVAQTSRSQDAHHQMTSR
jgi:hypothetical protein